jgi:hypothetical protein
MTIYETPKSQISYDLKIQQLRKGTKNPSPQSGEADDC